MFKHGKNNFYTSKPYQTILPVLMLAFVLVLSACSLGSSAAEIESTPISLELTDIPAGAIATETPRPTNTPAPTNTPTGNISSGGTGNTNNPVCTPRTDWALTYTVVVGDTLGRIAQRGSTTTSTLAQGNCLANANNIAVGQVLRVPSFVAAPSPTPAPTAISEPTMALTEGNINARCDGQPGAGGGYVSALPVMGYNDGCYTFADIDTVVINWPTAPQTINTVVYLVRYPNTMNPAEIGRSTNRGNNFQISVPVNNLGSYGALYAWAETSPGQVITSTMGYFRVRTRPITSCGDITDPLGGPNPVVISPATQISADCYAVTPGAIITVSWPNVPAGTTEVTFYRANRSLFRPDVIGVDNNPGDGFFITWQAPTGYLPPSTFYAAPNTAGEWSNAIGVIVGG